MTGHAAANHPNAERLDYAMILAALVGVDDRVAGNELGVLADYCDQLGLDDREKRDILAFTRRVDAAAVIAACDRLKASDLRFTVVSDLLYIAWADERYGSSEREVIEGIARSLGISWRQLEAMEAYATAMVRSRVSRHPTDVTGDDTADMMENAVAGLAAAGVPVAAVAMAAASSGITAVGPVAAGLTALGMGTIGGGVAAAAALSVGSFFAVRALYRLVRPA